MPPKKSTKRGPKKCDSDRALAAAEVLSAVWLSEKNFELETKIDETEAIEDENGHTWVTVRIHVPRLDIDMWESGEHCDQNQDTGE